MKGQKRFPAVLRAFFGSIKQGAHCVEQCAVFQHNFLRYPHPAFSIYDLFKFGFSIFFLAGRAATARLSGLPASPFWPSWNRQQGQKGCRCTLPSPWVGAAIWGSRGVGRGMNHREKSRHFRVIETDYKMHDGEGETHYESFIFWQCSSWCRDEFIERHIL